jgi:hypothetical protein
MASSVERTILALMSLKASEELKNLLENKHLYQGVNFNPSEDLKQQLAKQLDHHKRAIHAWSVIELPKIPFTLVQPQVSSVLNATQPTPQLPLTLPHPSLYCCKCKRKEAFAPVWYTDVSSEIRQKLATGLSKQIQPPDGFQMFFLVYQCQRCLGRLEGFLIRRETWSFGLHGRSPIELVEIPAYIPEKESWLYRDAVVAFNSGKILAGLFYLRTFIEQFARRVIGAAGKSTGDELFDEYYKTLPAPMKDHMPSLREWYDKLSGALHSANGDSGLFQTAKDEIERHFDFRRIYKMPETKPVTEEKQEQQKDQGSQPTQSTEHVQSNEPQTT